MKKYNVIYKGESINWFYYDYCNLVENNNGVKLTCRSLFRFKRWIALMRLKGAIVQCID